VKIQHDYQHFRSRRVWSYGVLGVLNKRASIELAAYQWSLALSLTSGLYHIHQWRLHSGELADSTIV
jgi:hypothetical protein